MKYINFDWKAGGHTPWLAAGYLHKTGTYKKLSKNAKKAFLFRNKPDSKRVGVYCSDGIFCVLTAVFCLIESILPFQSEGCI